MKNVYFERLGIVIAVIFFVFSSYIVITRAGLFGVNDEGDLGDSKNNSGVYFFTNNVNTSPEEVGNYFYDSKLSDQANELPDFSSQEVTVVSDAIFDGDITFVGVAENDGIVNGNAEFIGDQSENYGTVSGTLTRRYIESISTQKDFTANDERWTVVADGAEVDVTSATYNNNTTFLSQNRGSFVSDMNVATATITDSNLRLDYNRTLNDSSLPAVGDFTVLVNHQAVGISSVNISGEEVELRLTNPVTAEDEVVVSYSLGDNLILSEQGLNSMPISDMTVTNQTVALGNNNGSEEDEDPENNQGNNEENNQQEESVQTPQISSGGIGVFPLGSLKLDVQKNNDKKKVQTDKKKITEKTEKKKATSDDEVIKEAEPESISVSSQTPETQKEIAQKTKENTTVTEKLKNSLLLAVEDKGTIWYVAPTDSKRYEVSSSNAINLFRKVTLGITNKNLEQVPVAGTVATVSPLAKRLSGRFLLQVESRGESWYVDNSGYRHRVNSDNLVETVKKSVQGINNQTLNKIPVSK